MEKNSHNGFTLIELIAVVTIIGIIAAIALPNFRSIIESRKLVAAANTLQSDFQFAKSQALKRNKPIVVSFNNINAANWCYGLNEDAACDCSVANDCDVKTVNSNDLDTVILQSASELNVSFDQFRGFASPAPETYIFDISGRSTGVNLELNGRTQACSDDSIGGFASC